MGLILDTGILILAERRRAAPDLSAWADRGPVFISAVTVSELLVGVHRADTPARKNRRAGYVEALLAALPVLPFDTETARVHAQLLADLPRNITIGAHDLIIAATALQHGHAVLTANPKDFSRLPGVEVLAYV